MTRYLTQPRFIIFTNWDRLDDEARVRPRFPEICQISNATGFWMVGFWSPTVLNSKKLISYVGHLACGPFASSINRRFADLRVESAAATPRFQTSLLQLSTLLGFSVTLLARASLVILQKKFFKRQNKPQDLKNLRVAWQLIRKFTSILTHSATEWLNVVW